MNTYNLDLRTGIDISILCELAKTIAADMAFVERSFPDEVIERYFETEQTLSPAEIATIESWIVNAGNLTLTADPVAGTVTVNEAGNYDCYLWARDAAGDVWEQMPTQDPFTPLDLVLDDLTASGEYLVFAVDPTTGDNGYIIMEVE
jgi:hypothetical protein